MRKKSERKQAPSVLRPLLENGEKLLWEGRPGSRFTRGNLGDPSDFLLLIGAGYAWSFAWQILPHWELAFNIVLLGPLLLLISWPWRKAWFRKRSFYGVTTRSLIQKGGILAPWPWIVDLKYLRSVSVMDGNLHFRFAPIRWYFGRQRGPVFYQIEDPETVAALINAAAKKRKRQS